MKWAMLPTVITALFVTGAHAQTDNDLYVIIGSDRIEDNDANDRDQTPNSIVLDGFTPTSVPGLQVNDTKIELRFLASGGSEVASTSSTLSPSAQWSYTTTDEEADPIDVLVEFGANVRDLFNPSGLPLRSTVHLDGEYVKVDENGDRLAPGSTLNEVQITLSGLASHLSADGTLVETDLGELDGGLVSGEAADVPFSPADIVRNIGDSPVTSLIGRKTLHLSGNG